jgi:ABC-2 type transport system ATP-binding protein
MSGASSATEAAADARPAPSTAPAGDVVIDVRRLSKTFTVGLFDSAPDPEKAAAGAPATPGGMLGGLAKRLRGRAVEAVKGVSFTVQRGEIFGFLGPNGAGKTTTIKMLTGLIAPTGGEAFLFGKRVPAPESRERIGFLPENPYVYPYLTPREFVELSGRLSGLKGARLLARTNEVLAQANIAYAADRQVRRLSKGMLQRAGLAAALVSDPEMLILDEPMSGLDPVGRKEVRDLIFAERDRGRTIFFSTHILSDVEAMCDRVAILRDGRVVLSGALRQLLREEVLGTEVALAAASDALCDALAEQGFHLVRRPDVVLIEIDGEARVGEVLQQALAAGARVIEVSRKRETLEDLFLKKAL